MATTRKQGHRRPDWPVWVYEHFNLPGLHMLEAGYASLKESSGLERAGRISAADYASSVYGHLLSTGVTEFFQSVAAQNQAA